MKIKEAELREILEEVSADLAKAFASEKEKLSKAVGDEPEEESVPAEGSESAPPAEASDSAPAEAPDAPPAEASADMPAATPDGAPSPDAAPVDPAADAAPLTPEALKGEYAKLAPEELDMHIKAALEVKASLAGSPDAPPAEAPMAPPMDAAPAGPPAMKAELKASPERAGKDAIEALGKAEAVYQLSRKYEEEIENLKTLAKSSQEDVENLTKILTRVLEQPLRKAVTTVAHLPKVEEKKELDAASVHARLKELAAKPDLKKAERQLINDFYDGRVKADKLAPLFEDHK